MANCRHFLACSYLAYLIRKKQNIFHSTERTAYSGFPYWIPAREAVQLKGLVTASSQRALAALNCSDLEWESEEPVMFKYHYFTFTGYDSTLSLTSRGRVSPHKTVRLHNKHHIWGPNMCINLKFSLVKHACLVMNHFPVAQALNGNEN